MTERKTKKCTKCGKRKRVTMFHRRAASRDGLQPICKPCACAVRDAQSAREGRMKLVPREQVNP